MFKILKKILFALTAAIFLASCSNNQDITRMKDQNKINSTDSDTKSIKVAKALAIDTILATGYYLSDKIEKIYQFKDSLEEGKQLEYYENGQVKSELFFKAGKMDGIKKKYDEKGNITVTAIYKEGVRIE